ncbi:protease, partial [Streptomyces sp. NPDC002530]
MDDGKTTEPRAKWWSRPSAGHGTRTAPQDPSSVEDAVPPVDTPVEPGAPRDAVPAAPEAAVAPAPGADLRKASPGDAQAPDAPAAPQSAAPPEPCWKCSRSTPAPSTTTPHVGERFRPSRKP